MQMIGRILSGMVSSIDTKKGTKLPKTRLKVLDLGDEVQGDVQFYWIDFLGDVALSETELDQVRGQQVTVDIRRVTPSLGKDGKAYVNVSGGMVLDAQGKPVQAALRQKQARSA
jgi:hypothetical protein